MPHSLSTRDAGAVLRRFLAICSICSGSTLGSSDIGVAFLLRVHPLLDVTGFGYLHPCASQGVVSH